MAVEAAGLAKTADLAEAPDLEEATDLTEEEDARDLLEAASSSSSLPRIVSPYS